MKSKIIKITAFLLLVIVGCFITSYFSNKEKVKADAPITYYFEVVNNTNYADIYLYLLDNDSLVNNNVQGFIQGYNLTTPYESSQYNFRTCEFLRYGASDKDDYFAYKCQFSYNSPSGKTPLLVFIFTGNLTTLNLGNLGYNISFPYYPTYKQYYDNGYNDGYQNGYQDGTNDRNAYWEDYIEETYESTTGSGYQRIFEVGRTRGYQQGQESIDTTDWLQSVATDVGSILDIKLMPFITIGGLIFIPFMFLILSAVLWIWRRK